MQWKERLDEIGAAATILTLFVFGLDTAGIGEPEMGQAADLLFPLLIGLLVLSHGTNWYLRRQR